MTGRGSWREGKENYLRETLFYVWVTKLQLSCLYILLHIILDSGVLYYVDDSTTQEPTKTLADNNSVTESQNTPGDPKRNNPKRENYEKESESGHLGQSTKTPVFPSTPVKVYDDA